MDCTCRVLSHGYWITESSLMLLGHVHSWSAVQVSPYAGWWSLRPSFTKHRFQILWNALGLLEIHTFFYLTEIPFFVYKSCSFWYLHCAFPSQTSKDLMVRVTSTVHLSLLASPSVLWDTSTFMLQEMRTTESCGTHEYTNCLEGMEQSSPNYSQLESDLFAAILR